MIGNGMPMSQSNNPRPMSVFLFAFTQAEPNNDCGAESFHSRAIAGIRSLYPVMLASNCRGPYSQAFALQELISDAKRYGLEK